MAPTDEEQIAAWDAQSETWWAFDEVLERGYRAMNERIVQRAGPTQGARVYDVACGTGGLAACFVAEGAEVVATDFSRAMVKKAALRGLDARALDASATLRLGPCDVIVSRMGAFFFPDVEGWLVDAFTTLRPGGRLVLGLWGHPHEVPLVGSSDVIAREFFDLPDPPAIGIHRRGGPDVWPEMLQTAGYTDVQTEDVVVATPFGDALTAVTFLQGLAGDLSALGPPEQVAAFWEALRDRLPMRDGLVESRGVVVSGIKQGRPGQR